MLVPGFAKGGLGVTVCECQGQISLAFMILYYYKSIVWRAAGTDFEHGGTGLLAPHVELLLGPSWFLRL